MATYNWQSFLEVKDFVAVVSGGGSGLGKVIAHALAANGAKAVFILGRREEALMQARDSSSNPQVIYPIICDVTSKASLAAAADRVRKDAGYCNAVFANSGISTADIGNALQEAGSSTITSFQEKIWQPGMDDFTKSFHVNVTGAFYTAVAFLGLLDEANKRAVVPQKSQIIITTSVAGLTRVPSAGFAYGPSKAAAIHLTKQMSTALAPFKIRVNAIAPGMFPSEMTDSFFQGPSNPRKEGCIPKEMIPLERCGLEEELAGAVLFLISKAGGYIDGNVLVADGGHVSITPASY